MNLLVKSDSSLLCAIVSLADIRSLPNKLITISRRFKKLTELKFVPTLIPVSLFQLQVALSFLARYETGHRERSFTLVRLTSFIIPHSAHTFYPPGHRIFACITENQSIWLAEQN